MYAVIGVLKLLLTLLLSKKCEIVRDVPVRDTAGSTEPDETAPLLVNGQVSNVIPPKKQQASLSLLPKLSKESRSTLTQLCLLFALDSFASGLAPMYVSSV